MDATVAEQEQAADELVFVDACQKASMACRQQCPASR